MARRRITDADGRFGLVCIRDICRRQRLQRKPTCGNRHSAEDAIISGSQRVIQSHASPNGCSVIRPTSWSAGLSGRWFLTNASEEDDILAQRGKGTPDHWETVRMRKDDGGLTLR
jgi:hypothetical protein